MRFSARPTLVGIGTVVLVGSALMTAPALAAPTGQQPTGQQSGTRTVLVLGQAGASDAAIRTAITRAGGTVTQTNKDVGMYTVQTSSASFTAAARSSGSVAGVATDRVIGRAPKDNAKRADVEKLLAERSASRAKATANPAVGAGTEPLAPLQWDMDMIHAPEAHATSTGKGVRVGIIDTGVDGTHPDIAPHFNAALSRNFTVDDPTIDGPCADEPDGSCTIRRTSTRTATAPTSRGRSPHRSTGSASRASPLTRRSSTCVPGRTRATSSSSRRSTHSPMPATTASTW